MLNDLFRGVYRAIIVTMNTDGTPLGWTFSPLDALRRWPRDERVVMLHSGRFDANWARYSLLAQPIGVYRFVADPSEGPRGGYSEWEGPGALLEGQSAKPRTVFVNQPFADLRRLFGNDDVMWVGHLSYDVGRWVEDLPWPARVIDDARSWPVVEMACCPGWLVYDAATRRWYACGTWRDGGIPALDDVPDRDAAPYTASAPRSNVTRGAYESAVVRVADYIAAGDVFQVNLAQQFTADFDGAYPLAHRALYEQLANVSPAWYGAYLELPGQHQRVIASTSPELFLDVRDGHVITRPIKGTLPADADPAQLRDSVKDAAELHMIVDLLRNDLGRVCAYGSVRVRQPRRIETHPTVHHGVATIEGRLHGSKDLVDLLRATVPGGSITGAPKVRAMQIIDELETTRRGPYCGCIGYVHGSRSTWNIAIRTMSFDPPTRRAHFSVGSGIVSDSTPSGEYNETLAKAAAMIAALRAGRCAPAPVFVPGT